MTNQTKYSDNYDRFLTSAETAARQEREANNFQKLPETQEGIDTTSGYTIDREGLANNYAIEPEMYIEVPGDLRAKQEAEKAQRAQELKEINQPGGKGPGII